MPALVEEGRAKVNLTLRVIGRRTDGYHDLESLVAFADCADRVTLAPGHDLKLTTTGPLAGECGETSDNLVLRAALLLAERVPGLKLGEFTLDKVLPVAAGIGGGSADAAAALRLLARLNSLSLEDPRLREVALLAGADVPVCLLSRASDMTGSIRAGLSALLQGTDAAKATGGYAAVAIGDSENDAIAGRAAPRKAPVTPDYTAVRGLFWGFD